MQNDVVFKFSCPGGASTSAPSQTMTDALRQLSESPELQGLVAEARERGRKVILHVFHGSDGHPILIHLGSAAK